MSNFNEYTDFDQTSGPTERNFGLTMGLILMIFATFGKYKYQFNANILFSFSCIACMLLLTSLITPAILRRPNQFWHKFGILLHKLITPCIMFVVYLCIFVPIGLILKVSGKTSMLNYANDETSFWINKAKTDLPNPMLYQF